MTSEFGKNQKVAQETLAECVIRQFKNATKERQRQRSEFNTVFHIPFRGNFDNAKQTK